MHFGNVYIIAFHFFNDIIAQLLTSYSLFFVVVDLHSDPWSFDRLLGM